MKTHYSYWQSNLSVLLALGVSSTVLVPGFNSVPVMAQSSAPVNWVNIEAGTVILATYVDAERIILQPEETLPLTLVTTENILSPQGTVLIPAGSTIEGQLEPTQGGAEFVAQSLVLKDQSRWDLNATSEVITRTEEIDRGIDLDRIWQGALIGSAAAAVLSEILGDVGIFKVLGGAGAGALGGTILGRRKSIEVIVVEPETDLDLTLNADLVLN